MATATRKTPEAVYLKDCVICLAEPRIFKAELNNQEKWAIVCPDCGFQMIGRRVKGLAMEGLDVIEVTKVGDDFDEIVSLWNRK